MNIIDQLNAEQMTQTVPDFRAGDTVLVQVKVKEGNRERLQAYEGVVIARRNRGLHSSFTVRKMSHGEGASSHEMCSGTVAASDEAKTEIWLQHAPVLYSPMQTMVTRSPQRPRCKRQSIMIS